MVGGTEQGQGPQEGAAPGRGRRLRQAGLAAAVLIVVLGAAAFWVLGRAAPWRDPLELLPSSTRAAVAVDMRLQSPGMRQAVEHWSKSDLKQLGSRGIEIGQKAVNWLGLDLEVRKDVLPWFGGKLVVAVVQADPGAPVGPDSLVLIAATKHPRRTRASMEKGARQYTEDGYWRAVTAQVADETVTVWRDDKGVDQLAYVVKDSCLLLAKSPEAIEACLRAGQRPADRFTATPAYQDSVGKLSREAIGWAYADVGTAVEYARFGRAWLQQGTYGVVREYLAGTRPQDGPGPLSGSLAVGLMAAKQGAELRLVYDRAKKSAPAPATGSLQDIAHFVPREAIAYVALHRPADLLQRLPYYGWPRKGKVKTAVSPATPFFPTLLDASHALGFTEPPTDVLLGVLPRGRGVHPAFVLVAPAKQVVVPPKGSAVGLLKVGGILKEFAVSKGYAILGSDKEAVAQCQQAAAQGEAPFDTKGEVQFVIYSRPGEVYPALAHLEEIRVIGRSTAAGGEGEISVVVPPRYLLGSD